MLIEISNWTISRRQKTFDGNGFKLSGRMTCTRSDTSLYVVTANMLSWNLRLSIWLCSLRAKLLLTAPAQKGGGNE